MKSWHKISWILGTVLTVLNMGSFSVSAALLGAGDTHIQSLELLRQGQEKAGQGQFQDAISVYTKAIEINPKYTDAYPNRGLAHHDLGDSKRAIEDFERAIQLDPNNAKAIYSRGEIKSDLGDLPGALIDLSS